MGHLHKAAMGIGLVCATGCEPPPGSVYELNDEQKDIIAVSIDSNDRTIPVTEALMKRVSDGAVFGADKQGGLADFVEDLHDAQDLLRQYQKEGRIYGFDYQDPIFYTYSDPVAFFHRAPLEEDQYIAMAITEDGGIANAYGSTFLHEAAHEEFGMHNPELEQAIGKDRMFPYSEDFSLMVKEQKDYSYLVSAIAEIPDRMLIMAENDLWWVTEGVYDRFDNVTPEQIQPLAQAEYDRAMTSGLALDQVTWVEQVVDQFTLSDGRTDGFGLSHEEILDVLSHETTIYPEAHEEYMEKWAEFKREFVDAKENTEAELPEEIEEGVMVDEEDEGSAEGEEGGYGESGRR